MMYPMVQTDSSLQQQPPSPPQQNQQPPLEKLQEKKSPQQEQHQPARRSTQLLLQQQPITQRLQQQHRPSTQPQQNPLARSDGRQFVKQPSPGRIICNRPPQLQQISTQVRDDADVDVEQQISQSSRHRRQRPLYRRLFNYVRQAWTGVKFALDSELEDLETPPRYRPDSLGALCKTTRFTESEIKRIYRGFKAECPTGVVREDTFKTIYAQFFPQGANTSQYAHYVFNTLDQERTGLVSFEDFVQGLSVLSRGSLDEKLRWTFSLYDINGDGYITREEMTDIVNAIYDLMGKLTEPCVEDDTVKEKVDRIFQKMDTNNDGMVTLDEFLECCHRDEGISASMTVFDTAI